MAVTYLLHPFESTNAGAFDTLYIVGASASLSSTQKRTGSYSLYVSPGASAEYGRIFWPDSEGSYSSSTPNCAYYRFYVRFASLPTYTEEIFSLGGLSGSLNIRLSSSGKLSLWNGTSQLGSDGSSTLVIDTWYRIELRADYATYAYELRCDGTTQVSGTAGSLSLGAIYFGRVQNRNSGYYSAYYDDFAAGSGWLGAGEVRVLYPNASGTYTTNWTGAYTDVDDHKTSTTIDSDTTYVYTSTSGTQTFSVNLDSSSTGGVAGTIHGVSANVCCRDTGTTNAWKVGLRIGSTDYYATPIDGASTYTGQYAIRTYIGASNYSSSDLDGAEVLIQKTQSQGRELRCTVMELWVSCTGSSDQTIVPDQATATGTAYIPTIVPGAVTLEAGYGAATGTAYDPDVVIILTPDTATSTGTAYTPEIVPGPATITSDYATSTGTAYTPTVEPGPATITADYATSTGAAYDPTLQASVTLIPDHAASTGTSYDPSIFPGAATITSDYATSTGVAYDPTLSATVTIIPDYAYSYDIVYDPVISATVTIVPDHATSTGTAYDPTLQATVTIVPDYAPSTGAAYDCEVQEEGEIELTPDTATATGTSYDPGVEPGPATITSDFATSTGTSYDPVLTATVTLIPDTATSTGTSYIPDLVPGPATITSDYALSTGISYDPILSATVTIIPDHATSTSSSYDPTLQATVTIIPDTATSTGSSYDSTLEPGPATITSDFATSTGTAYDATILSSDQQITPDTATSTAGSYEPEILYLDFSRPEADVSDGEWLNELDSNINLYESINEATPSHTDYIKSPANPVSSACEIKMSGLVDPARHDFHTLSYYYKRDTTTNRQDLTTKLMCGATEIASWSHSDISDSWTLATQTLTGTQAGNITDYTDLRVIFVANTPEEDLGLGEYPLGGELVGLTDANASLPLEYPLGGEIVS